MAKLKYWKTMGKVGGVSTILLLVGGILWGLYAINPEWNVITVLFGYSWFSRLIYGLVGLSSIYSIYKFLKK